MTEERKNEIWAMLPEETKTEIAVAYGNLIVKSAPTDVEIGVKNMLIALFGLHNLTAQAEEKPKEPKFKVGDMVKVVNKHYGSLSNMYLGMTGEVVEIISNHLIIDNGIKNVNLPSYMVEPYIPQNAEINNSSAQNCENFSENGILDSIIQSKSAESVEISTKEDAYFAYRLDLAKEIAVKVANNRVINVAKFAVETANEIVKRLKETEE